MSDLSPSELWAHLTALPRPSRLVDVPRTDPVTGKPVGQAAVVPLSQEEEMRCNAAAEQWARKALGENTPALRESFGYESTYTNELAVQIVWNAYRRPEDLELHAFPSAKLVRVTFTHDEVSALFRHYVTVKAEVGPVVAAMTQAEMRVWIERLAEGGSAFPFDLLSPDMQSRLLLSMASELLAFWTGTSSPGSPRESEPEPVESDEAEDVVIESDEPPRAEEE